MSSFVHMATRRSCPPGSYVHWATGTCRSHDSVSCFGELHHFYIFDPKKRKISAGTRSDLGRRCRDTFMSLKTTCRKLGVTFWRYLQDRINGLNTIPPLADLIRKKATAST